MDPCRCLIFELRRKEGAVSCLQEAYPELAAEWHPTKNGDLLPDAVKPGSNKKAWWLGRCGHEWQAVVASRVSGSGCPYCAGRKVLAGFNDLATTRPELAAEWNYDKNGDLTPMEVTAGAGKKVWWKCARGHEWEEKVLNRSHGRNCPYCSRHRPVPGENDLATTDPELASEWHPARNGNLTPRDVASTSGRKVWWLGKCGHEWRASPANRKNGRGCPYCSNRKVLKGFNDLATRRPDIAGEWDDEKNGGLKPENIVVGSHKKVWWKCKHGHSWKASVSSRTSGGTGCPSCNSDRTSFPEQALLYYLERDCPWKIESRACVKSAGGVEADIWIPESNVAIEYNGRYWHSGKRDKDARKAEAFAKAGITAIFVLEGPSLPRMPKAQNVVRETLDDEGLSAAILAVEKRLGITPSRKIDTKADALAIRDRYDRSLKEGSLAERFPTIASEWHPTRNGKLRPELFRPASNVKVWWLGKCGHEWQEQINNRAAGGTECPCCRGKRTLAGFNDLATLAPRLAAEWHPTKNGELAASDVRPFSSKMVWWLGKCGHEWKAVVSSRAKGSGCPYCSNQKALAGFNDLETANPELAAQWHPTKNGTLKPGDVLPGTNRKVWWRCEHGHEWQASVASRNSGVGCPYCSGRLPVKGKTDLATCRPDLAAEWHPAKNDGLQADEVSPGSTRKVWWKCSKCGREWQAQVCNRARRASDGCRHCASSKARKAAARKKRASEPGANSGRNKS